MFKLALFTFAVACGLIVSHIHAYDQKFSFIERLQENISLLKSVASFHISILYNKARFGTLFNFNRIASDACDNMSYYGDMGVVFDAQKNITAVHDGKKTPLYLGSIMRSVEDVQKLRAYCDLSSEDSIGIYTLNRPFECTWAGLDTLKNTEKICQYVYPTTDFLAPSLIDLVRAVRDLENRDISKNKIAYVHCKAGRGRSAVTIAAYLVHVFHKANVSVSIDQIIAYIKSIRPRISINNTQKKSLDAFKSALLQTGSLVLLCASYEQDIIAREVSIFESIP